MSFTKVNREFTFGSAGFVDSKTHGLAISNFDPHNKGYFHSGRDANRYESSESWRDPDSFELASLKSHRPVMPSIKNFRSKGEYLKTPITADYVPGTERIFFMIKTGATVLWKRLPVHLFTTLTKVPNFSIYSDMAGSIGGYEVIDVFENMTQFAINSDEFEMYRNQKWVHQNHGMIDASETQLSAGWDLDKWKNIPMLAHAYSVSPDSDWYVFMDGDSYFMIDNLMNYLNTLDPNEPLYLGSTAYGPVGPFAHGGSGVVISHKAIEETVGKHPEYLEEYEKKAFDYCCGDMIVSLMLSEKLGIEVSRGYDYPTVGYKFQGNSFWDLDITEEKWCQPILTFHHVTPHDIEIIWEYEKLKNGPARSNITYGMIYHDFYQPYIDHLVENWDNRARDEEFTHAKDEEHGVKPSSEGGEPRPYESVELCQAECLKNDECLSFRYLPHEKYCGLGRGLRLGRPSFNWIKHEDKNLDEAVSGWNIDRIRRMRERIDCDVLHHDHLAECRADGTESDRVEGWYRRMKQR